MNPAPWLLQADVLSQIVVAVLLLFSVLSWSALLRKAWLLHQASHDLAVSMPLFWQAENPQQGLMALQHTEKSGLLSPLALAAHRPTAAHPAMPMAAAPHAQAWLVRRLRDSLTHAVRRLHSGQTLLASVASTAPFVGLLGTVWGIHSAMAQLGVAGSARLAQLTAPVGEALVMTAAGIVVAIPAVLAYNGLGRRIQDLEAELEGFAHDLLQLHTPAASPDAAATGGLPTGASPGPAISAPTNAQTGSPSAA